ncbi:MAG: spermidine/putrescine ABC transporter substrate-binding protein [Puniceicoccaceae bacterium]|nr:MAG: spermidine/putrescine ABC transporter substrate-binding protein [Puniceicoccaceae bacterium]
MKNPHLPRFTAAVLLLAAGLLLAACAGDRRETISLFIWDDFIDPDVLTQFEDETGIRVIVSNYSSNEDLLAKLQVSPGQYDVIVPSDYMVQIMRRMELLAPLDYGLLTTVEHIDERFQGLPYDPEMDHSVPYLWGTTGIAYLENVVTDPPRTWREFFDPDRSAPYRGRISLLDDSREVLGAALMALGHSPNSRDEAEIRAAGELLRAFLPLVAKFDSDAFEDSLAAESTVLIQGWSGEITLAKDENEEIRYLLPQDGTVVFVDNLAIPASSRKIEQAHLLIDFLGRPEIAAQIVEFTYFGSANASANERVDPEVLEAPGLQYPPPGVARYLEDVEEAADLYERVWLELKSR